MTDLEALRKLLTRLNSEMYNWTESGVRSALYDIMSRDTVIHMCHPFGDLTGDQYYDSVIAGSDCGFGTFAGFGSVDPDIAYAKLKSLSEGAALVSK